MTWSLPHQWEVSQDHDHLGVTGNLFYIIFL